MGYDAYLEGISPAESVQETKNGSAAKQRKNPAHAARRGVEDPQEGPLPTSPSIRAKGIDLTVVRADINYPIRHGGRGIHRAAGGVAPQQRAGAGVQRIHVVVPRADVHHPIRHGGRGIYPTVGSALRKGVRVNETGMSASCR